MTDYETLSAMPMDALRLCLRILKRRFISSAVVQFTRHRAQERVRIERVKAIRNIVERLESEMQCNCDLDNWEPDKRTRHSWVCRIHKAALKARSAETASAQTPAHPQRSEAKEHG